MKLSAHYAKDLDKVVVVVHLKVGEVKTITMSVTEFATVRHQFEDLSRSITGDSGERINVFDHRQLSKAAKKSKGKSVTISSDLYQQFKKLQVQHMHDISHIKYLQSLITELKS